MDFLGPQQTYTGLEDLDDFHSNAVSICWPKSPYIYVLRTGSV
jgi:hypothetical protein